MLKNAEKFYKVYSNLSIEERKNTIIFIDNEPFSWQMARTQIDNDTKIGEKIIKKLMELDII